MPLFVGLAVGAGYDDTRRVSCIHAMNSLTMNDDVATAYATGMQMLRLEKTRQHVTLQTSFPDDSKFSQTCENAGGIFVSFSGVLDCQDGATNKTSTSMIVNEGNCFTPGPECQHYVEHPEDWQLDTNQVFEKVCTVRHETLEEVYDELLSSTTPIPAGKPSFVDHSASYRDTSSCMDAFKKVLFSNDDLTDEVLHHSGKTDVELLQMSPFFIQREYYNDDDDTRIETYQELCRESKGSFATFNGILDCLGVGSKNKGVKHTIETENAATCFPAAGCTGYTLGQWKIDTMMNTADYSCTIRPSLKSSEDVTNGDKDDDEANPDKSNVGDTTIPVNVGNIATLVIIVTTVLVVLMTATVVLSRRRNTVQRKETLDEVELMSTENVKYRDDLHLEENLPTIS